MKTSVLDFFRTGVLILMTLTLSTPSYAGKKLFIDPGKHNTLPKVFGIFSRPSRAKSYFNSGRLQEAIWAATEDGMKKEAETLRAFLKDLLENGAISQIQSKNVVGLAGITDSNIVTFKIDDKELKALFKFDGGTKMVSRTKVMKDASQLPTYAADANSEAAASVLDEFFGFDVVPHTVTRTVGEAGLGSLQVMVTNPISGEELKKKGEDLFADYSSERAPDKRWSSFVHLALIDFIIGNPDRHERNWLYLPELKRVVAIDHGLSFRGSEGGCLVEHSLFSIFGDGLFPGCNKFLKILAEQNENTHRTQNVRDTSELYRALKTDLSDTLDATYTHVPIEWIKPSVKDKIRKTTLDELAAVLGPYVQDTYLELAIERFNRVKAAFESMGPL